MCGLWFMSSDSGTTVHVCAHKMNDLIDKCPCNMVPADGHILVPKKGVSTLHTHAYMQPLKPKRTAGIGFAVLVLLTSCSSEQNEKESDGVGSPQVQQLENVIESPLSARNVEFISPHDNEPIPAVEQRAQAGDARSTTHRACSDGASPLPVSVQWVNLDVSDAGVLAALITNTNSAVVTVSPTLRMQSPRGDIREVRLDKVTVPAQDSIRIDVSVEKLPILSGGLASVASLAVSWDQEQATGLGQFVASHSESSEAYVTANTGTKTVAVRGLRAQAARESEERKAGERRISDLVFLEPDGQERHVATDELGVSPVVQMGQVTEVTK